MNHVENQKVGSARDFGFARKPNSRSRGMRASWPISQKYRAQLNEQGKKEHVDLLRDDRGLIQGKGISLPYRAIIADEAQDMSAEALRLLRVIVPEGPNDLFVVVDAHQRIYRHRTSLAGCGINIKGQGAISSNDGMQRTLASRVTPPSRGGVALSALSLSTLRGTTEEARPRQCRCRTRGEILLPTRAPFLVAGGRPKA